MKTEIKLTANIAYFQQRPSTPFDRGIELCIRGLHRYVKLPKGTKEITLCFFERYVAESFEIGRRNIIVSSLVPLLTGETLGYCMVDHPKTQLLISFRRELYNYYMNGFKFFRIEY